MNKPVTPDKYVNQIVEGSRTSLAPRRAIDGHPLPHLEVVGKQKPRVAFGGQRGFCVIGLLKDRILNNPTPAPSQ
jgi:hypothetical protein